jgi:hypothetical protein
MSTGRNSLAEQNPFQDVGTLWTMRRSERRAHCKLLAQRGRLELRVIADGDPILADVCADAADAFALAEHWKAYMLARGWHQVLPHKEC